MKTYCENLRSSKSYLNNENNKNMFLSKNRNIFLGNNIFHQTFQKQDLNDELGIIIENSG